MKWALMKDRVRQIRHTLPRYLSMVAIVALGVAFYVGIRSTGPDMQHTGESFFDHSNLYDLEVLSTFGLNEDDVAAIRGLNRDWKIQRMYQLDLFTMKGDREYILKLFSLPEGDDPQINKPTIMDGRMPEKPDEVALDYAFMEEREIKIGDQIELYAAKDFEIEDLVHYTKYTVVGSAFNPLYITERRGSSSIGNGETDAFAYLLPEAFALEVHTGAYIVTSTRSTLSRYDDQYVDALKPLTDQIEEAGKVRSKLRYQEIHDEAQEKLADGRTEIADAEKKLADAEAELADAHVKLADGEVKLAEGEQKLKDAQKEYDDGIRKGEKELADARKKISDGQKTIDDNQKKVDDGKRELSKGKRELEAAEKELDQGQAKADELAEQIKQVEGQIAQLDAAGENLPPEQQEQLATAKAQLEQMRAGHAQAESELSAGRKQLSSGKRKISESESELRSAQRKLDAARDDLEDGRKELADGERTFKREKANGAKKLADAKSELAEKKQELADAKIELDDAQKTFDTEKADAEVKIADAKTDIAEGEEDLADLKEPEWFVLDLENNAGFSDYRGDTQRISAIGEVFPIIFFLVAALVCLTAMTRMVDEERTLIGTMKALGYYRSEIAWKYLFYALSASLLGSAIGIAFGSQFFPRVIFTAYGMLYRLPPVVTPVHVPFSAMATGASIVVTATATAIACIAELRTPSAQLMRPKSPKAGKRIWLEYVPFLWKHFSFSWKVALRNLFRYKARLMMTIVGIAGCTALMLTGFGLRDSISSVVDLQYGQVHKYDATVALKSDLEPEKRQEIQTAIEQDDRIAGYCDTAHITMDATVGKVTKSVYLLLMNPEQNPRDFIYLRDRVTHESVTLSDEGVVITEKLATLLGVRPGSTITLVNGDNENVEAKVTGVSENYAMHYVYITPKLYTDLFQKDVEYTEFTLKLKPSEDMDATESALSTDLMEMDGVQGVRMTSTMRDHMDEMISNLSVVILVLIGSAGALAFVVLFNLNSINIDERQRELATVKLLGFRDGEVFIYVMRETILLTILGAAVGLGLGVALHRFVIITAEVDMVMFGRVIHTPSYFYSFILTIAFGLITNLLMNIRLKRIDMVESLKSVE